jgi:hypothetical protein
MIICGSFFSCCEKKSGGLFGAARFVFFAAFCFDAYGRARPLV